MALSETLLQYVVLEHTGVAEPHFDLLFERAPGAGLTSFRLAEWPVRGRVRASARPEHRREYLTYEGAISNGRGEVRRVAWGEVRVEETASGYVLWDAQGRLVLRLEGEGDKFFASAL